MPAYARSKIVPPDKVGVYHCIARCVRRAFLCGVDPLTKHDYDHRKEWIRERLEQLAPVFAIDICVADPARQVSVTSRLDRSTASGGESRGDPGPARADSGATGNHRRRLGRDGPAIRSSVQDGRRPTQCAGGTRCTQGQSLAPRQRRRRPGLSIAGRSVIERDGRARGAHIAIVTQRHRASLRWSRRETLRGLRFEPAASALERIALAAKLDDQAHGCL